MYAAPLISFECQSSSNSYSRRAILSLSYLRDLQRFSLKKGADRHAILECFSIRGYQSIERIFKHGYRLLRSQSLKEWSSQEVNNAWPISFPQKQLLNNMIRIRLAFNQSGYLSIGEGISVMRDSTHSFLYFKRRSYGVLLVTIKPCALHSAASLHRPANINNPKLNHKSQQSNLVNRNYYTLPKDPSKLTVSS